MPETLKKIFAHFCLDSVEVRPDMDERSKVGMVVLSFIFGSLLLIAVFWKTLKIFLDI
jgi:hypothetical protein